MEKETGSGTLFIVATPIGNLEDLTIRALKVLEEVDLIAAEDTRHTRKLLSRYQLHKKLISIREHNEVRVSQVLIDILKQGRSIAFVTDGGTPAVSDPGYRLVAAAAGQHIDIHPLPGPSALTCAISICGFDAGRCVFQGFLPVQTAKRKVLWLQMQSEPGVIVFFEAPHRMERMLREMQEYLPDRDCVICREMTKIHETFFRGTPGTVANMIRKEQLKGEFVIAIGPSTCRNDADDRIGSMVKDLENLDIMGMDRDAVSQLAERYGIPFRKAYKIVLEKRKSFRPD